VKVVDVTDPEHAAVVSGAVVPIADARNIYPVRTYAYVAAGAQGLVILDIEKPEQPKIDQVYNAGGQINDARDVKVGMTNVSLFAYVADGKNGLRVIQLTSPETPGNMGFSPRPAPELIATKHTHGLALAVSEGIDRDRAIDESGNQLSVFGRRGARPLNLDEIRRMITTGGQLFTVPELRDLNIKRNRDIREFYGAPRRDAETRGGETRSGEERRGARKRTRGSYETQARHGRLLRGVDRRSGCGARGANRFATRLQFYSRLRRCRRSSQEAGPQRTTRNGLLPT